MSELATTVFHAWHTAHNGRMVEFGGWHMPVQYTSIVEEHHSVRQRVGVFDVSHMGRLKFSGAEARQFLDHLLTNYVAALEVGQIRYSLVCNEEGGVLDDVLVYRFRDFYMLVVNASNRLKILKWIESRSSGFEVDVDDQTTSSAMLAIQGPNAIALADDLGCDVARQLKYYTATETEFGSADAIVSRTGYTGEDGIEVTVAKEKAVELLDQVMSAGKSYGIVPAGLGCRDTLRLESGMPLYGHELDETIDPITAGLQFAVKLDVGDFVGRAALARIKEATPQRQRIGLTLEGRRIAREGAAIYAGDECIGQVTSGTFSPTLEKPIAMGYVKAQLATVGSTIDVDIRGKRLPAKIVKLPFYKRAY